MAWFKIRIEVISIKKEGNIIFINFKKEKQIRKRLKRNENYSSETSLKGKISLSISKLASWFNNLSAENNDYLYK